MAKQVDKKAMACNKPKRTPSHPKKSHVVKACEGGKEKDYSVWRARRFYCG